MALMENDDAQKKGVVLVLANMGPNRLVFDPEGNSVKTLASFLSFMPFRFCSYHWCADISCYELSVFEHSIIVHSSRTKTRMRIHFGSFQELYYKLLTFGIPHDSIPFTQDGTFPIGYQLEWVQNRQDIEKQRKEKVSKDLSDYSKPKSSSFSAESQGSMEQNIAEEEKLVLGPNDVKFGLGRWSSGNSRFLSLVGAQRKQYDNATLKFEKTVIAMGIVMSVKESGGAF